MTTIYYPLNRQWPFIFHFIYYMIGGFRHIAETKPIIYIPYIIKDKKDIDKEYIIKITNSGRDIYYPMNEGSQFPESISKLYMEILETISHKYTFIYTLEGRDLSNVSFNYFHGEQCGCYVPLENTIFLKELFSHLPKRDIIAGKKIYITRQNSGTISAHNGVKSREVINNEELINSLTNHGFICVRLENLSFIEKIELFQTAEIIISPMSSALSFILFANKATKIIELFPNYNYSDIAKYNVYKPNWDCSSVIKAAQLLDLNYQRFGHMKFADREFNMEVDLDMLDTLLKSFIA